MQQQRENDYINAARRRSTARQHTYDRQRAVVDEFSQNIYSGPINPWYCCTCLCYSNGGSFIDPSDPLLLPIHDRELSVNQYKLVVMLSGFFPDAKHPSRSINYHHLHRSTTCKSLLFLLSLAVSIAWRSD